MLNTHLHVSGMFSVGQTQAQVHARPSLLYVLHTVWRCRCCFRPPLQAQYLRLMLIWTITTAFSGVFQPLLWLDNASGSITEQRLVWTLLALSIAGMAGNVSRGRSGRCWLVIPRALSSVVSAAVSPGMISLCRPGNAYGDVADYAHSSEKTK